MSEATTQTKEVKEIYEVAAAAFEGYLSDGETVEIKPVTADEVNHEAIVSVTANTINSTAERLIRDHDFQLSALQPEDKRLVEVFRFYD